ncbi:MAG: TlyA family RNA methyltransferase [Tissierellia bacterium]|nr:TlyA family RNA methyltransferase [Tissierellia bacterium]
MKKYRADALIHMQGLTESREKAKRIIMQGKAFIGSERISKPGDMLSEDAEITLKNVENKYVSRGGYKLEKAIESFELDLNGYICGDFGASTGGFTDCMLQNGAKYVYAIDVGYGQIDWKLRTDERVNVIERTNIRYLDTDMFEEKLDLVSIDVSFISLTLILPPAFSSIKEDGRIIALIKPQFEAGKGKVGKKGIVKDINVHKEVIEKIVDFTIANEHIPTKLDFSPITGAQGNIEYLVEIRKNGESIDEAKIDEVIERAQYQLLGE